MSFRLIRDMRSAAVGAAAALLVVTTTGAAAAVYVANADRVDHKHAVGAAATVNARAGKLVATNTSGYLPNNIIKKAPDSAKLAGQTLSTVQTQWLSVINDGTIAAVSPGASHITVTHPATGTYCVSLDNIIRGSVTGNVQSYVNGFTDITLVVTSLYNTSACPNNIRIYTAQNGTLTDYPFTLTFALSS